MAEPVAISCTESSIPTEGLFRLSLVDGDGERLECADKALSLEDLFRGLFRINDDGTYSIAITWSGDTITLGAYWRWYVEPLTHNLLLQRYKNGAWQTQESNTY